MREISLTVASKEFTELVNEVEQGESFVITRRGRPIAKLTPHCADRMVGCISADDGILGRGCQAWRPACEPRGNL